MYKKKIVLYVEGQTEQLLLNQLILTWWNYSGIKIENIKLLANENTKCKVPPYSTNDDPGSQIFFQIIDIAGAGSLPSAIASRAQGQRKKGFEIVALRDLRADDYERYRAAEKGSKASNAEIVTYLTRKIREALAMRGCRSSETVEVFFAILEIEAWLLSFTTALSIWAGVPEEKVLQRVTDELKSLEHWSSESIKGPGKRLEQVGRCGTKEYTKAHDVIKALVSHITAQEIQTVYESSRNPSFSKFWDRFVSLKAMVGNEK